jgi:uncharacterized membrane protein
MIKSWRREIALAIQAKTGVTTALFVWLAVMAVAALTAFIFLCVAGYDWFALQFGGVFAGLIMTGVFLLVAIIAALLGALARRHARERAILERAARAHAHPASWLLDPRLLATALRVGRTLGWHRLVPVALLGFMAAQWAREYREHGHDRTE